MLQMVVKWHTTEGVGSTAIEGAGGKMASWLNDAANWYTSTMGKTWKTVANWTPAGLVDRAVRGGSKNSTLGGFVQREVLDKSDLRSAQLLEGLSNVPIVGNMIRGIQGVNRLEDLYNNTGRTAYYAGTGVSGAGALGSGVRDVAKIADGVHDLYQFYSGTPDDFRSMTNNMYG